ncbi:hypothetical protein NQ314_013639 [Rhamnusium bicolor]|uniref:C2H2-type domain-containing protein n=1 Tax=Rhamnusium bicolor TaxID=1586634 RepID=A0AAV8X5M0_9CUCU|nr:hypothetical protein NQ314_013639 [Rhamnusium bicolor]
MEEKPIKTEVKNEETLEIKDIVIDNKPLNEEIEKDIPDFVNVNNFRHIKRIHDAGKTYFCKICSQKVENYNALQQHRAEQHPEASEHRQCSICPMIFKSSYSFKKHKKEHANNGEFQEGVYRRKDKCYLCGEKFQNYKLYIQHKDYHLYYDKEDFQRAQKNGSFTCKLCQREFQNKQGLFQHMPFHMEKTEKCNICQEFFTYYGYSNHKRRVHLPLECKICKEVVEGTVYIYAILLSVLKAYYCGFCDMEFEDLSQLKYHRHSPTHIINIDSKIEVERDCEVKSHFDEEDIEVKKEPVE